MAVRAVAARRGGSAVENQNFDCDGDGGASGAGAKAFTAQKPAYVFYDGAARHWVLALREL